MFNQFRSPLEQMQKAQREEVVHSLRVQAVFVVNDVNFLFDHQQVSVTKDAIAREARLHEAEAMNFAVDGRAFVFTMTYSPNVQLSSLIAALKKASARALWSESRNNRSLTAAGRSVWIPGHRLISEDGLQPEA